MAMAMAMANWRWAPRDAALGHSTHDMSHAQAEMQTNNHIGSIIFHHSLTKQASKARNKRMNNIDSIRPARPPSSSSKRGPGRRRPPRRAVRAGCAAVRPAVRRRRRRQP